MKLGDVSKLISGEKPKQRVDNYYDKQSANCAPYGNEYTRIHNTKPTQ